LAVETPEVTMVRTSAWKKVVTVKQAPPMHWVGDGLPVRTMFSYDDAAEMMSPFLLLDYAAPAEFPPSERRRGVGAHPHRGFETVTIVYQGDLEHRDSAGNHGSIGPGDVQWMTAGSGVLHEEKHGPHLAAEGGTIEMVQLWVNLPARSKMTPPRYQDLLAAKIPKVALPQDAGTVRVVAGAFGDAQGPAHTFTPIQVWDLRIREGATFEAAFPEGHTLAVFFLHGRGEVNEVVELGPAELAVLERGGERLKVSARAAVRALVLSGEPIAEPVVGYGPFVMNTEAEIRQAITDFQGGRMGRLDD
jgi:redox-sensitive bicupin YhaK (pirin superfamily)